MEDLRILKNVYPEVVLSEDLKKLLKNAEETLLVERKGKCPGIFDRTLLYLLILYSNMSFEKR